MPARVFLHIGQPKTGTTYLQDVVWGHREQLLAEGLLLPGTGHREHLWAALDVQERPGLHHRHPDAVGTWERLCAELDAVPDGDALITHEFFCGATAEQAQAAVDRLAPAEVHLVITARHAAALFAAGYQEAVKNGAFRTLHEVDGDRRRSEFTWRTWDLGRILKRWGPTVAPERVHVVPMPRPGSPPGEHWRRFASVLGLRGEYTLPEKPANQSLGAVEVELLRRVNEHLEGFDSPTDRGTWIRGYLAEERLRELSAGRRFGLPDDLLATSRAKSVQAIERIVAEGYDVVGDLDELAVPDDLPRERTPYAVEDAELLATATRLTGAMLADVRELTRRLEQSRGEVRALRDDLAAVRAAAREAEDARPVTRVKRAGLRVRDKVRPPRDRDDSPETPR